MFPEHIHAPLYKFININIQERNIHSHNILTCSLTLQENQHPPFAVTGVPAIGSLNPRSENTSRQSKCLPMINQTKYDQIKYTHL